MLGVGWACFLGSWLINIAYYKFHPSAVEMSPLSNDKKTLFVFGRDVFSSENHQPSLDAEVEEGKEMEMESLTGDITENSTDVTKSGTAGRDEEEDRKADEDEEDKTQTESLTRK